MKNTCRIGIGGPVGSGKTALIEAITPRLLDMGYKLLVITNDYSTIDSHMYSSPIIGSILGLEICSTDLQTHDAGNDFKKNLKRF